MKKLLTILGLGITCCVQATPAIESFITKKMNEHLSPYNLTNCSRVAYYPRNSTNEISIANVKAGDLIVGIVEMPIAFPDPKYTGVVGFIKLEIPFIFPPSNLRITQK